MAVRLLIFAIFLLINMQAHGAGDKGGVDVRGGGGGVRIGDTVYSLDLVEAGVEAHPYFNSTIESSKQILTDLALAGVSRELPLDRVAIKIKDVESIDAVFAAALKKGVETLLWSFVDLELNPTDDLTSSVLKDLPIQLAVRQGPMVRIQRATWQKMNADNQAALVLHEVVAALAPVETPPSQIRRLLGSLFTFSFYRQPGNVIDQYLRSFPSFRALTGRPSTQTLHIGESRWFTHSIFSGLTGITMETEPLSAIKILDSGETYFAPYITLNWKSYSSVFDRIRGISRTVPSGFYLTPDRAEPGGSLDFCPISTKGPQLVSLVVDAMVLNISLAETAPGAPTEPKLQWDFAPVNLAGIVFTSDLTPSCSSSDPQRLELLKIWTKTLR